MIRTGANRFWSAIALAAVCMVPGAWLIGGWGTDAAASPGTESVETLVVGGAHSDAKRNHPRLEKMANYLASRLGHMGVRRGRGLVVSSQDELIQLLRDGAIHVFSETAFGALRIEKESGAVFLAREWKKGLAEYRTVFFTLNDSPIYRLADLVGHTLALEDRGSTSGFQFPMALLAQQGIKTVELNSYIASKIPGKVGYVFADQEINIAVWVARGMADAGAFSSQDWEDLTRTPAALRENLRLFHTSEPLIRSAILAGPAVPPDLREAIRRVLFAMEHDREGVATLQAYNRTKRYDALQGEAARGLEKARALLPYLIALEREHR